MARRLAPAKPEFVEAFESAGTPEMVGRNCRLEAYEPVSVRRIQVGGEFIAYASPDSTYAVTKRLIDEAEKSILIGIYDFTADYVKELCVKAMRRSVKGALMLDLDNRSGETEIFDEFARLGWDCVPAPSCASDRIHVFASSHEKVIVIDDEWSLVQSGNYSENSIPLNEKDGGDRSDFVPGNRDMGVAVRSKPLAAFLREILEADMTREREAAGEEAAEGMADLEEISLLEVAPPLPPKKLFPSKRFNPAQPVSVLPILTPDNYMDVVPDWLRAATRSISVEQQYIRGKQEAIGKLLAAIREAITENDVKVRIVLAQPFPGKRFDKEAEAIRDLGKDFGLKLGTHVRILSPRHFVHCHNKLIIVDEESVLVSSQNWSDSAVLKNREAGLLVEYPPLARHYSSIFDSDWDTGLKTITRKAKPEFLASEAFSAGKVVRLNWGDYVEV